MQIYAIGSQIQGLKKILYLVFATLRFTWLDILL